MKKSNKNQNESKSKLSRQTKKIAIWLLTVVVVYVLSMFIPIIGGYTSYPYAVLRCGKLPVVTNNFMAAHSYSVPGTPTYAGPNYLSQLKNYVCSIDEAEAQGYIKRT